MKKIIKAFTLIELIVGITISMLLMVSVGLFISGGMQNILLQQKVLENTNKITDFTSNIQTNFNIIQNGIFKPQSTSSGILLKIGQNFSEGGFAYIGTQTLSGVYCESDSENPETNSLYIKNFIPFEENGEDIFTNYESILTASGGTDYISYQKENKIVHKDDLNKIIIGKGIFGDKFEEGIYGTGIYLNSPTGLANSGTILFISDTLNNRILYYDTVNNTIHKLLDETDGLNEPTGLYYEDSSLYISNSGNGEILKYSSKSTTTPNQLTLTGFNEDINEIEINFPSNNLSNLGDFSFNGYSGDYYLTGSTNTLKYYFILKNSISNQGSCSGNEIIFNNGKPSIYCINSGSGQTVNYPNTTISEIRVNNLSNFSSSGNYYVKLKLFNSTNEKYYNISPYFTQSDNDLTTKNDNILEIINSGLNYPTGIWGKSNTEFNEFGKLGRTYSDIKYEKNDTLLGTPINKVEITNKTDDLINLVIKYYKSYNCYNLDEKIERTILINKNLK